MSKASQKILYTAESLFNRDSFSRIGVDLIRDESGCSKTTLYTHFKNKQQLVEEVLKTRDLNFRESLSLFIGNAQDLTALELIFDWHVAWFKQDNFKGCLFIRAVSESTSEEQTIIHIAQQHKQWLYQFININIVEMKNKNEVTELFYTFLESMISRILVEGLNQDFIQTQKQLLFRLISLLQV
ncbi:TetR/AcrR family transcriptional regulator [Acinetobacter sp. MD2]|uniref:TetR/AcrR family transcriptional regulator n=1 Tax=Acinetobacter sp. MD2 TaxID=2600066 RepID=UPI002D1EB211|nr:TetR/AcrR family transcriptional regulator [Acinetobacter sp. MD2]MEB3767615.1 TetR/AcrR family transcriptional regulator [Acinetobacter sp. MD2]